MTITAKLVSELREKTGAGMMDCKKALVETNGDFEQAVDWLRQKGLSAAAKKSGRAAADGLVAVYSSGEKSVVVEVNSETDFVAKNDQFQSLVDNIRKIAINCNGSLDDLLSQAYGVAKVSDAITSTIATIGENINLRRYKVLSVNKGVIGSYIHNAVVDGMGKIAVLIALESSGDSSKLQDVAKKICMHIAASNPACLTENDIDPALLAKEREVFVEMSKEKAKNEEILNKMVEGRLNKYKAEVALLSQPFVMDNKMTVTEFVASSEKEIGAEIKVTSFVRYELGEGVEVATADFASEVASLI